MSGVKLLGVKTRTNSNLNPHMTPSPEIEPGSPWWEVSAVTNTPNCIIVTYLCWFSFFQIDKIVKEKEAQFNEEKNSMWKELTDAFQKVFLSFQLGSQKFFAPRA